MGLVTTEALRQILHGYVAMAIPNEQNVEAAEHPIFDAA